MPSRWIHIGVLYYFKTIFVVIKTMFVLSVVLIVMVDKGSLLGYVVVVVVVVVIRK